MFKYTRKFKYFQRPLTFITKGFAQSSITPCDLSINYLGLTRQLASFI